MSFYVYRVEDRDGRGPYVSLDRDNWALRYDDHEPPVRPGTHQEYSGRMVLDYRNFELPFPEGWLAGFRTRAQAEWWFRKAELRTLKKLGFHLKRIRASKIYWQGKKQLAFQREVDKT